MKVDLFMLMGKMLDYSADSEIEIVINKKWFNKKGYDEFKIKFVELGETEND